MSPKKEEQLKREYKNYMVIVNCVIQDTETRIEMLEKHKEMSKLSFEDWCKLHNKE